LYRRRGLRGHVVPTKLLPPAMCVGSRIAASVLQA
jgi:hypothetical protein